MNYEKWAFHDVSPVSAQLKQKLMYSILSGKLSAGDKIPSVREMAELIHINPNTVVKAYKAVKQEELIICSNSKEYSVTQDKKRIEQIKEGITKEICCTYLSKMFELGFNKLEAAECLQAYCKELKCHD